MVKTVKVAEMTLIHSLFYFLSSLGLVIACQAASADNQTKNIVLDSVVVPRHVIGTIKKPFINGFETKIFVFISSKDRTSPATLDMSKIMLYTFIQHYYVMHYKLTSWAEE